MGGAAGYRMQGAGLRPAAACPGAALLTAACLAVAGPVAAQPMDELVVTGRRTGTPAYERPYNPTIIDADALELAPQRRLDEALRSVPGFGLFRRSGSRTANPTTQGVSLRGIGPNGAGRTLVLLDGVPMNDPFGGWIPWSRLPTAAVERVSLTRGGGAGPWGNVALAGTIRIDTRVTDGLYAEASGGGDGTAQGLVSVGGGPDDAPWTFGLTASGFRTDGVPLVRADRRGPIDRDAAANSAFAEAVATGRVGDVQATAKLLGFTEFRDNGTPFTENRTDGVEGSVRLTGGGRIGWEAVAYVRDYDFASTFSGVNDARTAETPALDQFDVPSRAVGGIVQVGFIPFAGHETDIGVDVRRTRGETNEFFLFQAGAFRRLREAGGRQTVAGLFAEHAWVPDPALTVAGGLRLDHWRNADGRRIEINTDTGATLRNDDFGTATGTVVNGRIGVDWSVNETVSLRGAFYSGFRLPTLNELYRPFRVGNDIVEANPALEPERLLGGEVGVRLAPAAGLSLEATLFRAVLTQAVDNVELTRRPGNFAPLGIFVPAGGSLSQRLNLDRTVVDGVEAEALWQPVDRLSLRLAYLFSAAEIVEADGFPELEGNRLGQAPRHQGTVEGTWRPVAPAYLKVQLRAASFAFEDSGNAQRLDPFVVVDASAGWDISQQMQLFATVENLADREVQTGVRADGLTNVGPGRQWQLGLRIDW